MRLQRRARFTGALATVVLLAAGGLVLASCGGSDAPAVQGSPSAASTAAHNDADVMFAQMMIPHHETALDMAKLAARRARSADVKALAARIPAAQGPEITMMRGWLTAWGAAESSGATAHGSMPGQMSDSDMDALEAASGRRSIGGSCK